MNENRYFNFRRMEQAQYQDLFNRAKKYAFKKGLADESEDFAQEVLITASRVGPHINFEFVLSNYFRDLGADKRKLSRPGLPSLDTLVEDTGTRFGELIGGVDNSLEYAGQKTPIWALAQYSTGRLRAVVGGMIKEKSCREISETVGVSKQRVALLVEQTKYLIKLLDITDPKHWAVMIANFKMKSIRQGKSV